MIGTLQELLNACQEPRAITVGVQQNLSHPYGTMVLVATTEFSELLISARKDAGIESPSDAARRLGITPQRLGNWENGISQPKYDMLKMISELYGVPN